MRLTCKQIADAWNISPTKATQARDPTFRKIVALMKKYPHETAGELAYWFELDRLDQMQVSDAELAELEARQAGRCDRRPPAPSLRRSTPAAATAG